MGPEYSGPILDSSTLYSSTQLVTVETDAVVFRFGICDRHRSDRLAGAHAHDDHALRCTTNQRNLSRRNANDLAARVHHHHVLFWADHRGGNDIPRFGRKLHGRHTLAAAPLTRILRERGPLSKPLCG